MCIISIVTHITDPIMLNLSDTISTFRAVAMLIIFDI
jgi:hypothetical protein